jgi:ABC-type transporter Mla MlaB component
MLRISPIEAENSRLTLLLEGRVAGPWVAELWKACEKALSERIALTLNLAEVSFLDPAAIVLLANLRRRGVEFHESPPFIEEQLKSAEAA